MLKLSVMLSCQHAPQHNFGPCQLTLYQRMSRHGLGRAGTRDFLPSWIKLHPVWLPLPCMLLDTVASLGQVYRARAKKGILGKGSTGSGDVCNKILEKELLQRFCYDHESVTLTCSGLVCGDRRMSPKKCLWLALKSDLNFEVWPFGDREMMPERNLSTGASDRSHLCPSDTLLTGVTLVL